MSLLFSHMLMAQREQVTLKVRNAFPLRAFSYHQPSQFEVVNGKLHASLASANGYLFEINGVPASKIKCGSSLTLKNFQAVLIDNRMDRTYTTMPEGKGSLFINCLKDGKLELLFTGTLYYENQKVIINANLAGEVAHSRKLKTN